MSGDPVWLADVLRAAGLVVDEYPGWRDRGHGDFGPTIWGVFMHHTGSEPPSDNPAYIADHPQLGLCSQLHLNRKGEYTVVGAGIAYHAGAGSYPGLPTDNANQVTIGIEAENNGTEGWTPVQYDAYVRGVAAILSHLGQPYTHAIGHKEYAGASQGKWDPGAMDMNRARADIRALMSGGKPVAPSSQSHPVWDATFTNFKQMPDTPFRTWVYYMDQYINEIHRQTVQGWAQLGHTEPTPEFPDGLPLTLVDGVARVLSNQETIMRQNAEILERLNTIDERLTAEEPRG